MVPVFQTAKLPTTQIGTLANAHRDGAKHEALRSAWPDALSADASSRIGKQLECANPPDSSRIENGITAISIIPNPHHPYEFRADV